MSSTGITMTGGESIEIHCIITFILWGTRAILLSDYLRIEHSGVDRSSTFRSVIKGAASSSKGRLRAACP